VGVVLLPDGPYPFSESDDPDAFRDAPTRLVKGRLITWCGTSLLSAHDMLQQLVARL
jgi:hypothetical protein